MAPEARPPRRAPDWLRTPLQPLPPGFFDRFARKPAAEAGVDATALLATMRRKLDAAVAAAGECDPAPDAPADHAGPSAPGAAALSPQAASLSPQAAMTAAAMIILLPAAAMLLAAGALLVLA